MKAGDIGLSQLVQADGQIKPRPVLLLRAAPPFNDFIVCGISSQLHNEVRGFDEIIGPDDPDFSSARLRAPSLVRLAYLGTVAQRDFRGRLGSVSPERLRRLLARLAGFLRPEELS